MRQALDCEQVWVRQALDFEVWVRQALDFAIKQLRWGPAAIPKSSGL